MARANRGEVEPAIELPGPRPTTAPRQECTLITEIAPLEVFYGALPDDVSADAAYNAMLQFMVVSGSMEVESQDPLAHTIITKHFSGQTWLSTCPVNRYFSYALRVAVSGHRVIVNMQCWSSSGWESRVVDGVLMKRNRGEVRECAGPVFVSKNDALIPSSMFAGAIELLQFGRLTPVRPRQ